MAPLNGNKVGAPTVSSALPPRIQALRAIFGRGVWGRRQYSQRGGFDKGLDE